MAVFTELHGGKVKKVRNRRGGDCKRDRIDRSEMVEYRDRLDCRDRGRIDANFDESGSDHEDFDVENGGKLCPVTGREVPSDGIDVVELNYDQEVVLRYNEDGSLAGASVC
jgi:hypothetical protein